METAKRLTIPSELKFNIKHEQRCRCLVCNHKFKVNQLQIHHIKPVTHFYRGEERQAAERENLCALCKSCHRTADHYAIHERIYLPELIEMRQDQEYILGMAAD